MLITKLIEWWRGNGCDVIGHDWKTTYHNGYMIDVEQRCRRCNKYRHHIEIQPLDEYLENKKWEEGKHPNRPNGSG